MYLKCINNDDVEDDLTLEKFYTEYQPVDENMDSFYWVKNDRNRQEIYSVDRFEIVEDK